MKLKLNSVSREIAASYLHGNFKMMLSQSAPGRYALLFLNTIIHGSSLSTLCDCNTAESRLECYRKPEELAPSWSSTIAAGNLMQS